MFDFIGPEYKSHPSKQLGLVEPDLSYDSLITKNGKISFADSYRQENEPSPQYVYARVSSYYGTNKAHSNRLYSYMSRGWFSPATPLLANGGTKRGRPISCNTNEIYDSRESIADVLLNENFWLATGGAGVGSFMGNIRSIGEKIKTGTTGGIFSFMPMLQSLVGGANQGSLRRANAAVYLPVDHPEIEDFVRMRIPIQNGDSRRKCLGLHHGILISDAFMEAMLKGEDWELKSPKTGEVIKIVSARELWYLILTCRMEKGEPYIIFSDTVKRNLPKVYQALGFDVVTSNLCSEILLKTGLDHLGNMRTGVCCLSSLNLTHWDEWKDDKLFIQDVLEFLDNVLDDYIDIRDPHIKNAIYAAYRERSVGLGVMGFHTYLQNHMIPFESALAKSFNLKAFKHIRKEADKSSRYLAELRGPCPDAAEAGLMERFANKLAVAPTASISVLCGEASAGIEPIPANIVSRRTKTSNQIFENPTLVRHLESIGQYTPEIRSSISRNGGSVQHLDFLDDRAKAVFKTARELDQRWLIEFAADRTPYICQSQSLNLFVNSNIHKKDLHRIHVKAWKDGTKSLYYLRSKSVLKSNDNDTKETVVLDKEAYDECLSCQ